MKTILKLLLFLISLNLGAQETEDATDFLTGLIVSNATEETMAVKIPLLDTNLKMNTWITAANLLDGLVSGTGTANYLSKFIDSDTEADSQIFDNGTNVGIGTNTPSAKLDVAGRIEQSSVGGSVFVGIDAGLNDDFSNNYNVFIGTESGKANTTGVLNTSVGFNSLKSNISGNYNSSYGTISLRDNLTGVQNTAMGNSSLVLNKSGDYNTSIGVSSLERSIAGSNGVAVGTGSQKHANNQVASWDNTNTSVGYRSLHGNVDASLNTGLNNTAIGRNALIANTSGSNNTVLGYNSASGITTGSENTIIGANVTGLSPTLFNHIIIADGDGNQRINVDETGNVGIGTNTPSAKLDVAGTLEVDSVITISDDGTNARLSGSKPILITASEVEVNTARIELNSQAVAVGAITTPNNEQFGVSGSSYFSGSVQINSTLKDTSGDAGTAGQVLSSTATGTDWVDILPRMTEVQRDAIASPEEGLLIYQTDGTKGWYGYNGTAWVQL